MLMSFQSTAAKRRLIRDFKRLASDPPIGISGSPNPDNIMIWNAVIFGPRACPSLPSTHNIPRISLVGRAASLVPFSPTLMSLETHANALIPRSRHTIRRRLLPTDPNILRRLPKQTPNRPIREQDVSPKHLS